MNPSLQSKGMDDAELIQIVLEGNTEQFAELVRRYEGRIGRLGWSFFHSKEDVEDFCQDVFVKAYVALGSFRGRASFSTWLLRIAYNTAINARRQKREFSLPEIEEACPSNLPEPEASHERTQILIAWRESMQNMSPSQVTCIELSFGYDMKYKEISEITDLPINTIKSHVFRAKRYLREKLKNGAVLRNLLYEV